MSLLQNSNAISTGGADYNLESSLRFRSSASADLSRTPASAGNRKTWTWSGWIKRGLIGSSYYDFFSARTGSDTTIFRFNNDSLFIYQQTAGAQDFNLTSTAVFRDPSSWYHIIITVDTTQATSSDRIKIYVNEEQITSFSTSVYPTLNLDTHINNNIAHKFGVQPLVADGYFDGYITEVNFVDGQALTPSDFGEYGEETGAWQAKAYTGTYGSNGYYLDMSTSGSTITDQSGNGNDFTATNMNLTTSTATTYDLMSDVPTLTDEDTGNFCTLNAVLPNPNSGTFSEANLAWAGASHSGTRGTFGMTSGKWYWEVTNTSGSNNCIGISQDQEALGLLGGGSYGWGYYGSGLKYTSGSGTSYGASYTTNDVIGVAFDADAGNLVFYKNGVSQGTAYTGLTSAPYYPAISSYYGTLKVNFGQRPFAHTPPTGFKKLNTYNLPDSTIKDGSQYMNTVLYTGTGSTQSVTGVGFSPDAVWIKDRTSAQNHYILDTVRGATVNLFPNTTNADITSSATLTSFDSDGFTVTTSAGVNGSGDSYVSWNWRGSDSSAVSNTDGTITSTVSANTTAGFSVVTYTGNGSAGATVGHGLGTAPDMIIVKWRSGAYSSTDWNVYHTSTGNTNYTILNSTTASTADSTKWNNTSPTSTVFTLGNGASVNGSSSANYVAYCFAEVEGFSKFGKFTGNGSSDGTFVYTGFRPAFVIIKRSDSANSWGMNDSSRNLYNPTQQILWADLSNADEDRTARPLDLLSNGFKIRTTESNCNASGGTYIYMCFAENPFKNSLAR